MGLIISLNTPLFEGVVWLNGQSTKLPSQGIPDLNLVSIITFFLFWTFWEHIFLHMDVWVLYCAFDRQLWVGKGGYIISVLKQAQSLGYIGIRKIFTVNRDHSYKSKKNKGGHLYLLIFLWAWCRWPPLFPFLCITMIPVNHNFPVFRTIIYHFKGKNGHLLLSLVHAQLLISG